MEAEDINCKLSHLGSNDTDNYAAFSSWMSYIEQNIVKCFFVL